MMLSKKIDQAIRLLQAIPQDGPIELSYSGGKDSDVCFELCKMAEIPFEAIYKNTTIDPPGTIAHCLENGVKIIRPKKTFFKIIEEKGMPTRFSRFCCTVLKEYKIHNRAIQGIRACESVARRKRYKEPEFCRTYSKTESARIYLPILYWTTDDVANFIKDRNIKLASEYYDADGSIHCERRLGCIGCPLQSDRGVAELKRYPKILKQMIKAEAVFLNNHPKSKTITYFDGSPYNVAFYRLFVDTLADYDLLMGDGLFPELKIDAKKYLESFFKIDLTF